MSASSTRAKVTTHRSNPCTVLYEQYPPSPLTLSSLANILPYHRLFRNQGEQNPYTRHPASLPVPVPVLDDDRVNIEYRGVDVIDVVVRDRT